MTNFPGSSRLLIGAIVGVDIMNPLAGAFVVLRHLATMTRCSAVGT